MQIEVAPNIIDLTDLSAGFIPDPQEASVPMNGSPQMSNVIVEPSNLSIEVRRGFTRLSAGRLSALAAGGFYIRQVFYYDTIDGSRKRYLICILTDESSNANNVRLYAYDLNNDSFTRIDTAGRTWNKPTKEHWSAIVEGTYYGGVWNDVIYSWHPTNGWDADPTTPSVDTWVDSITPSAGQKARNYAFKKGTKVTYSSRYYSALRGIRYKTWESGQYYSRGERVSRKADEGGQTYWRSFECIKGHNAGDTTDQPGTGATFTTYWKRVRLRDIVDADGDDTADWAYMPLPGKSSVGIYHGNRMWVRHDDHDNWSRLQYSAPARPEKGARIADLDWRPTDWAPVDDLNGDGGGWFDVPLKQATHIRGLWSLGNYLLIFGRFESFVLSGTNEQTWTLRRLGDGGVVNSQSMCEHDGLVYYLADDGTLRVTDGTATKKAPGADNIRVYLHEKHKSLGEPEDTSVWRTKVLSYGAYVLLSFPDEDTPLTIFYHPDTGSFWPTTLPVLGMAVGSQLLKGDTLYFSAPIDPSADTPTVFKYRDEPGAQVFTDDDETGGSDTATDAISWTWRSAWLQFGMRHIERRLRKVWALVAGKASDTVTVSVQKDFENSTATTTAARTLTGADEGEHIEGAVGQTGTPLHSVSVKLVGSATGRTTLYGIGVDTENLRPRFHR